MPKAAVVMLRSNNSCGGLGYLMRSLSAILLLLFVSPSLIAETYIIPMWATALPASDGTWWARAIGINTTSSPVSYRVTGVYPLQTVACPECTGESVSVTVAPGAAVPVTPQSHLLGARMIAGAFAIETSGPLAIDLVAYRSAPLQLRQRLDVARRWVAPGRHVVSTVERAGGDWRMNLFVVNPGDAPVTVSVWAGERNENERRQTIAARSTGVIAVREPHCNGVPCAAPAVYPPPPLRVEIEADGAVLTSVSSVTPQWGVFTLADEARE